MKLLVIADDLSGATEIAGVAHQCGLKVDVQLTFKPGTSADVLVVDLNTRAMSQEQAEAVTLRFTQRLANSFDRVPIFKKVDSVFRGHLTTEIAVLQESLGIKRVLLFPANPTKGRQIVDGHYLIDGKPLHSTVFGNDPHHPISTSVISKLLLPRSSVREQSNQVHRHEVHTYQMHTHVEKGVTLPPEGLITGDTVERADLQRVMAMSNPARDLCCGGAEFFEAWLDRFGFRRQKQVGHSGKVSKTLILNGSTVQNSQEKTLIGEFGVAHCPVPGHWEGIQYILNEKTEGEWHNVVLSVLNAGQSVIVTIDHPLKPTDSEPHLFSDIFLSLLTVLDRHGELGKLKLGLTGGATASDILRGFGATDLTVLEEEGPGVVSVSGGPGIPLTATIKPGSYPWPDPLMNRLKEKK